MIKTFLIGLSLGLVSAGALSPYFSTVNLHREPSLISVQPNGGAVEDFFIKLPGDRILNSLPQSSQGYPLSFKGTLSSYNIDTQAEIFKVRNQNGTVIGLGSRLSSSKESTGGFVEWSLHFPARGSMYIKMRLNPANGGVRHGELVSGTRDFGNLSGSITERVLTVAAQKPAIDVQIHLQTVLMQSQGDPELNM